MEAASAVTARIRVLIADDERTVARTLQEILLGEGFEVIVVHSGAKALEAARLWSPRIFLGDVFLPDVTGVEVAICVRALLPGCRVLLLSAHPDSADLLEDARLRGHDFELLLKPIHPTELIRCLRETCPVAEDRERRANHSLSAASSMVRQVYRFGIRH